MLSALNFSRRAAGGRTYDSHSATLDPPNLIGRGALQLGRFEILYPDVAASLLHNDAGSLF